MNLDLNPVNASPEVIIALIGFVIVGLTVLVVVLKIVMRRAPMKPSKKKYRAEWRKLQEYCKHKETWPAALLAADKLLDKALIKRGYKGRTTGERMVSAQRKFTDNDELWFAHKLCKKLQDDPDMKLKEKDVKHALLAFSQALKDLGAL